MPNFNVDGKTFEIHRNSVILDTNVLVHRYVPTEKYHGDMVDLFDVSSRQWIVSYAVMQEVWGMINSKVEKTLAAAIARDFHQWLINPGSNVVLIPVADGLIAEIDFYSKLKVDCVDGIIYQLAIKIGDQCSIRPLIATYDTRDFYPIMGFNNAFDVCNMETDYADLVD